MLTRWGYDFGTYWYEHCRVLSTQSAVLPAECPPAKMTILFPWNPLGLTAGERRQHLDPGCFRKDQVGGHAAARGRAVDQEG